MISLTLFQEASFRPSAFSDQANLVSGRDFGKDALTQNVFNYNRAGTELENNLSSIYSTSGDAHIKLQTSETSKFYGAIFIGSCLIDKSN